MFVCFCAPFVHPTSNICRCTQVAKYSHICDTGDRIPGNAIVTITLSTILYTLHLHLVSTTVGGLYKVNHCIAVAVLDAVLVMAAVPVAVLRMQCAHQRLLLAAALQLDGAVPYAKVLACQFGGAGEYFLRTAVGIWNAGERAILEDWNAAY